MKRIAFSLHFHFEIDWKFFAITPAFNINIHSKAFEVEWLFFGLYISTT